MSSGSRAAAAANSRRVKQRLVKILFGETHTKQGREAHRNLDFAAYTYDDLRKSYFEQVQLLHPDKSINQNRSETIISLDKHQSEDLLPMEPPTEGNWRDVGDSIQRHKHKSNHAEFIDLKEAWEDYHRMSKALKKGNNARSVEGDFTMFGVGCSFSDSPAEQRRRSDIMDQACRGWISDGKIGEGCDDRNKIVQSDPEQFPTWSTDVDFKDIETNEDRTGHNFVGEKENIRGVESQQDSNVASLSRRSLIDHLLPKQR